MPRITIRLDDELYNKLTSEADKLGLTLSDIIRAKLTKKNKINKNYNDKLIYELHRIGNNFNQITKHINIKKVIDRTVAKTLLKIEDDLKTILGEIKK